MKVIYILFSTLVGVLGAIINASEDCHADNCLRAVAGLDPRYDISSRRELCSSWVSMSDSLSASPTVPGKGVMGTENETTTAGFEETTATLPRHATVCKGAAAYSSACSCWGITAFADAGPTITGLSSVTDVDGRSTADPTFPSTSVAKLSRLSTGSVPAPSGRVTSGILSSLATADPALSSGTLPNASASTRNTSSTSPSFVLDPTPSGKSTITGSIIDGPRSLGSTVSSVLPVISTSMVSSMQATSSSLFSNSSRSLVLATSSGSGILSSLLSTRTVSSSGTLSTSPTTSSPSSSRTPFTNTSTNLTSTTTGLLFPNSTLVSPSPTPTACTGGTCDTYRAWPCSGPLGDCLCGLDPTGASFCFEDNECALEANCAANSDCPRGQRCVVRSCCLASKCVIERNAGTCGNANGARMLFRLDRRGKAGGWKRCGEGRNSGGC